MIVNVIGSYGTETMGDRAILDGILRVIQSAPGSHQIFLGSLYPFYTERTLLEEADTFRGSAPSVTITLYDVKRERERLHSIEKSDVVLIGGGPLMDIQELYLLRDSFCKALARGIPRLVFGCGMGPLNKAEYISVTKEILMMATAVSFRDKLSMNFAHSLYGTLTKYVSLGDPAVISIENFHPDDAINDFPECYASVNLRAITKEYTGMDFIKRETVYHLLQVLSKQFENVLS